MAKEVKCERTHRKLLLKDGFIVGNPLTGEWSFVAEGAPDHPADYNISVSRLLNSPESFVDWMAHLHEKSWFQPNKFFQFFERLCEDNDLYGQQNF